MSIGDWIQVIAIVVSLLVSVVSIIQTQKSIKITETRIKEESRPYLSFYVDYPDKRKDQKFFVVENFGTTSAKVISITFDKKLDKLNENFKFASLINGSIAPGQRFTSYMHPEYKDTVIATLIYQDLENNLYNESFEIKTDIASTLLWASEDTPQKAIRESNKLIAKSIKEVKNAIITTKTDK